MRASVRRMLLDDVFEQKNDVAKNVEELEKVNFLYSFLITTNFVSLGNSLRMLSVLQP